MRVESDWPAKQGMGGHFHRLASEVSGPPPKHREWTASSLNAEALGEIGEWILDQLSLERWHLDHLQGPQRRFSEDQIRRRGYRSWPDRAERHQLAERAAEKFGTVMRSYPGYYEQRDGAPEFVGPPGLVLPVRDACGYVEAFQVRPDSTRLPKRFWLSSLGRRYGTGSGSPPHVSMPAHLSDFDTVYIVEGVFSADICSDRLGARCIGLSGITNWRAIDWSSLIRVMDVTTVRIALDRDRDDGQAEAQCRLLQAECKPRAETSVVHWDSFSAKGFDDCLMAGLTFSFNSIG